MKLRSVLFLMALAAAPIPAMAQSSAQPVVPGNLTVSGCPGGGTPCFNQFSTANPLAVSIQSGGGTDNVNITQVGGNTVATGSGASSTGTLRVIQSTDSLIGAKGADGSTITSTTNPIPTEAVPSNAASVAITPCVSQGASTLQCGTAAAKNAYVFYLTATADSWLMIFNTTTTPANGATTAGVASGNMEDCVKVPSGTTVSIGGLPIPKRYSVGAYMAISSTACATLTLATTGLLSGLVQ